MSKRVNIEGTGRRWGRLCVIVVARATQSLLALGTLPIAHHFPPQSCIQEVIIVQRNLTDWLPARRWWCLFTTLVHPKTNSINYKKFWNCLVFDLPEMLKKREQQLLSDKNFSWTTWKAGHAKNQWFLTEKVSILSETCCRSIKPVPLRNADIFMWHCSRESPIFQSRKDAAGSWHAVQLRCRWKFRVHFAPWIKIAWLPCNFSTSRF